jgi:hypothetical protein
MGARGPVDSEAATSPRGHAHDRTLAYRKAHSKCDSLLPLQYRKLARLTPSVIGGSGGFCLRVRDRGRGVSAALLVSRVRDVSPFCTGVYIP